jgi:oligoribonuclease NrnB/cAMP/cGMP phosphodiesterase (DHH superfamily)
MDGIGAAWAAWMHLKNTKEKTRYIGVKYGEKVPKFEIGDNLFILDFCYSPDEIIEAAKTAKSITLIDHHKTSQEQHNKYWAENPIPQNAKIIFKQENSGCVLTWKYFHPNKEIPELLKIIEDHDLWRFEDDRTKAIMCALHSKIPFKIQDLTELFGVPVLENMERIGDILLEQRNGSVARLKTKKHSIQLGSATGLAVNAPPEFSNELGHELAEESGTFGVSYQYDGSIDKWMFAIRSTGDYDVSSIAKLYGGGGHKNAAGFSLSRKQFEALFSR